MNIAKANTFIETFYTQETFFVQNVSIVLRRKYGTIRKNIERLYRIV